MALGQLPFDEPGRPRNRQGRLSRRVDLFGGQMILELGVTELIDRAGLSQHTSLVGLIQKRDGHPGESPGDW